MKSIKDTLIETFVGLDFQHQKQMLLENMNEFFNNEIPENIIKEFEQKGYIDYVWENLQTHDYKLLQKKLEQYFGDKIEEFIDQVDESGIFAIRVNDEYLYRDETFINLLNFFNYFLRERNGFRYVIEPIYSKNMDEWVYKNCNGIIYHFTDKDTAEKILKSGLRIKGRTHSSFAYPKRIYLYAPGFYLNSNNTKKWMEFAKQIINPFMVKKFGLSVLKIDLNRARKSNISFYRDTAMGEDAIFTYNNIPKECITELNI